MNTGMLLILRVWIDWERPEGSILRCLPQIRPSRRVFTLIRWFNLFHAWVQFPYRHHSLPGYPCPCPMTATSEQPGCLVMPQRSWVMPHAVTEEPCRAPAPACRSRHVRVSLQDQTSQCNATLIILPAFSSVSFVADLFLQALWKAYSSVPGRLLFLKVILPTEAG